MARIGASAREGDAVAALGGSRSQLRRVATRAVAWQTLATVVVQVTQTVVTLVVAAVTSPRDFALLGIASVFLSAQWMVAGSLGLGLALINSDDRPRLRDGVDSAFLVNGALGLVTAGATFAAAPAIASAFGHGFAPGDVTNVIRLLSLILLFGSLADVPQALVEKSLDFRRRACVDLGSAFAYVTVAVTLIVLGSGVWSVIVARVVQSFVSFALFIAVAPVRPRLRPVINWQALRSLAAYGKFIGVGAVVTFVALNVDNVLVAVLAGATALGAYALAYTITNVVPTFLTMTLGKVTFPLYASIRGDQEALRRAFAGAIHSCAGVMLPTTVALVSFAPEALNETFGRKWEPAAPLIRVLAVYGLARAIALTAVVVLNADGRPQYGLWSSFVSALLPLAVIWPLSGGGVEGIAWSFALGQGAAAALLVGGARSLVTRDAARSLGPPAVASLAAALLGFGIAWLAPEGWAWRAAASVFVVSYAIVLIAVDVGARSVATSFCGRASSPLPLPGGAPVIVRTGAMPDDR